ncbi:MAG: hypothetical protein A2Y10_19440 [Planctomycetes bacterium GWF2_41_51]|nr:MAG: hypothetical protein A2Y10_19440 [Planctomycetes bacterium GWF2_41_51]
MEKEIWLDYFPMWGIFVLTIAVVMVSMRIGRYLGNRRRRKPDHESEASLGTIIGSTLGLLGFLIVFSFGLAAERFQQRKQILLDEINAIGTTHLRAGLLAEPHKNEIRDLLKQYVDIRANLPNIIMQSEKLEDARNRSEELQEEIWDHVEAFAKAARDSEMDALFIESLNKMIDLHTVRITVFHYRIPTTIWAVLYFTTIVSMLTVGYQAGISGKSSLKVGIVLALIFTIVIMLIVDLDRAASGSLQVSQKPMLELQHKLKRVSESEPWQKQQ